MINLVLGIKRDSYWKSLHILLIAIAILFIPFTSNAVDLPKTGQTTCWDSSGAVIACAGTGQDGDKLAGVAWPGSRFTDNSDGTMTDNLTGLMWTKDASYPGPPACDLSTVARNWQDALNYVACLNTNNYLGYSDWRIPNRNERVSLANLQAPNTATWLGSRGFTNVYTLDTWSSTTRASNENVAWVSGIRYDTIWSRGKGGSGWGIWAVRSGTGGTVQIPRTGQTDCWDMSGTSRACAGTGEDGDTLAGAAWPSPRFTDNGDGTVTDNLTTLVWLKDANCFGTLNWSDALTSANSLADGSCGLTDGSAAGEWGLPNRNELFSLFDASQSNPALPSDQLYINVMPNNNYWTSTTTVASPASAWVLQMEFGTTNSGHKSTLQSVWPVRGMGVTPAPDIDVTDSVAPNNDLQAAFGNVTEMTTADQSITVTNDGNADLVLGNIAVANPLTTPFSILNDTCSGQTLTAAANCTFTVRFSPGSIGSFSDNFDIPSNDADENPVTFNVSGNGIGVTAPDITVTDAIAPINDLQIPFGNVTEMTTADQTVTVTNDGNANLVIGNVATANFLAAPFSVQNDTCSSQTLTPAGNCTLTIRFEPTTTGAFSDSFDIPSNDADEDPVTVTINGTGIAAPVADITVTDSLAPAGDLQIPFTDLTIGGTSDQTVTITNNGNADLVIGNIAQANTLAAPFNILNDTCSGQTVAATTNCTFVIRFAPVAIGMFSDSFDIPSNDADENPVIFNVTGTGLAGVNNPPSTPMLVSPANGQQGLSSTVTLQWNPSTDPDGDSVSYDVYHCLDADPLNNCTSVATVASFDNKAGNKTLYASVGLGGGIMIMGITFAGALRSRKQTMLLLTMVVISSLMSSCFHSNNTNTNKTYTVAGLATSTTYHWAIVAKDGNGGETQSAVWSYTTAP